MELSLSRYNRGTVLSKILHVVSLRIPLIGANHDKQPQTKRYTSVDDTDLWIFNKGGSFDASNLSLYRRRWLRRASCWSHPDLLDVTASLFRSCSFPPGEQRSNCGPVPSPLNTGHFHAGTDFIRVWMNCLRAAVNLFRGVSHADIRLKGAGLV